MNYLSGRIFCLNSKIWSDFIASDDKTLWKNVKYYANQLGRPCSFSHKLQASETTLCEYRVILWLSLSDIIALLSLR